jgi:hypothetical protein
MNLRQVGDYGFRALTIRRRVDSQAGRRSAAPPLAGPAWLPIRPTLRQWRRRACWRLVGGCGEGFQTQRARSLGGSAMPPAWPAMSVGLIRVGRSADVAACFSTPPRSAITQMHLRSPAPPVSDIGGAGAVCAYDSDGAVVRAMANRRERDEFRVAARTARSPPAGQTGGARGGVRTFVTKWSAP